MRVSGHVAQNWTYFREAFEDFSSATELNKKGAAIQVSALKSVMGPECKKVMSQIMTRDQATDTKTVLDKLEKHFTPKRNILYERHEFFKADQLTSETIDQYVVRLRQLADPCSFKVKVGEDEHSYENDMIRDRLVFGALDKGARRRVFREKDMTLDNAIEILRLSEITKEQLSRMGMTDNDNTSEVNAVRKLTTQSKKKCKFCLYEHVLKKTLCKAWGKTCNDCHEENHFAGSEVCKKKEKKERKKGKEKKRVHQAEALPEESDSTDYDSDHTLYSIRRANAATKSEFLLPVTYHTQNTSLNVMSQLDTGANCSAMPFTDLCRILGTENVKLSPAHGKITLYDSSVITPLGTYTLSVSCNGTAAKNVMFDIVSTAPWPIIAGTTCVELGWLKLTVPDILHQAHKVPDTNTAEAIIKEYNDIFDGELGCIGTYQIEMDPAVRPVQHAPRRVPVALKPKLKAKLGDLEKRGVVAKVTQSTDWISSCVIVEKPGKFRLCIDPRDLNKAIKRPKYPMPTLDDILPKLAKAKVFSVLDAKDGFHQVKLEEDSSYLTTFWTPFGRYRYLRLPFGISSAPEEFQRRQHEIVTDLEGVDAIADDILIYGCGDTWEEAVEDHNRALKEFCQRAREVNLKMNKSKLRLCLTQVPFMGFLLTNNGVVVDPKKVQAIMNMPCPEDKKAVKRLLGSFNYLARFMPQLSEVCEPLHRLTDADVTWCWESSHQKAFENVKELISSSPVLRYYNVDDPVTVQCDASEHGLGAVLLQNGQPVAYASRTLNPTERHYAQIEKECLGIVFGCERFSQYLLGRQNVVIETDHKPLETIFRKSLLTAPKRLQRMLLRLQRFNLEVRYKKGSELYLADMLSRASLPRESSNLDASEKNYEIFAAQLERVDHARNVKVSDPKLQQIRKLTQMDPELLTLMKVVLSGWPDEKEDVPPNIQDYYNFRDEITLQDGILYKGSKVIIPTIMRDLTLMRIHGSHQGAEACIRKARDIVFWPRITAEIKEVCQNCETCAKFVQKQQKEPMQSHKIPDLPWQIVSQDIFTLHSTQYLVTVDHYSDYFEIDCLPDLSSETVVNHTKQHFARHGVPEVVVTDNGPQYVSAEYAEFAKSWEFSHVTSSPYHSQGNGKAEAAVKITKMLLKKAKADKKDPLQALLEYRNTPTETIGTSPAQRLMSRRTRTLLPTAKALLQPEVQDPSITKEKIKLRRQRAKIYYDRGSKHLPEIMEGEPVMLQPNKPKMPWERGSCLGQVSDRSYLVKTDHDTIVRRNRKFLRPAVPTLPAGDPPPTPQPSTQPTASNTEVTRSMPSPAKNKGSDLAAPSPIIPDNSMTQTRSGRAIKRPLRLDL